MGQTTFTLSRYLVEFSVFSKRVPINNTEEVVEKREDDELSVEQFIDAALPSQKQVKEGPQTCISDPAGVRHRHRCCLLANLLVDRGVT